MLRYRLAFPWRPFLVIIIQLLTPPTYPTYPLGQLPFLMRAGDLSVNPTGYLVMAHHHRTMQACSNKAPCRPLHTLAHQAANDHFPLRLSHNKSGYSASIKPSAKPISPASPQQGVSRLESPLLGMSKGLPPPDSSVSGAGSGDALGVELDAGLVDVEGWPGDGRSRSGGLVVVETTGPSVGFAVVEVESVVGGRTVVKMSAGLLEVRVASLVELLLELETGDALGQNSSLKLPARTWPSTVVSGTSTPLHTAWTFRWTSARPLMHLGEHVLPCTKSSMVHPGMSLL